MDAFVKKLEALRRSLHEWPETAFEEHRTQETLEAFILKEIGSDSRIVVTKPYKTSLVIEYRCGRPGEPFMLFRADMDALYLEESQHNTIVSKRPGFMHACGHDIHMTILAGLIAHCIHHKTARNLLFVFQPGEEGAGGAKGMIESGVFDRYPIAAAFALHVTDDYALGEIASNSHILFAIPREIDIQFKGTASHAAFPHEGHDALAMAARFLGGVHHTLARTLDPMKPFLCHIGQIEGGSARNITADCCVLKGTLRALEEAVMDTGFAVVKDTAEQAAASFGGSVQLTTLGQFLPVINSPSLVEIVKKAGETINIRYNEAPTKLVGEDFGFFCNRWPSFMFWLGTRAGDDKPQALHTKTFFPGTEAVVQGLKVVTAIIDSFYPHH